MRFIIQYFKEKRLLGEKPSIGTMKAAQNAARDGLIVYSADFAKILDERGQEAMLVKRANS